MIMINLEQRSRVRMVLKSVQVGSRTGAQCVIRIRGQTVMTKTQSVTRIRA